MEIQSFPATPADGIKLINSSIYERQCTLASICLDFDKLFTIISTQGEGK